MSKKQKRQVTRNAAPMTHAAPSTESSSVRQSRRAPAVVEFNPDYSDVTKGLRRIGILAGTFLAILIGLSFFLK